MMHFPSFSSKSKSCILGHVAQSSEVHKKEVATLDLKKKEDVLLTPTTVTRPTRAIYKPPPSQRQKYCFLKAKREKTITERRASRGERKLPAKIDDHQLPQSTHAVSSANHHQMADEGIFSRFIFIFASIFKLTPLFFQSQNVVFHVKRI